MIRKVALALLLILACLGGVSSGEPFAPGKERDWAFLNLGKFRGTLVKIENGKAFIRMADGVVREFWPGQGDGIAWLPHLSVKARAKLRGEMNPDLMYGCGGDRPFLRERKMTLPHYLQLVWDSGDDGRAIVEAVKRPLLKIEEGRITATP